MHLVGYEVWANLVQCFLNYHRFRGKPLRYSVLLSNTDLNSYIAIGAVLDRVLYILYIVSGLSTMFFISATFGRYFIGFLAHFVDILYSCKCSHLWSRIPLY